MKIPKRTLRAFRRSKSVTRRSRRSPPRTRSQKNSRNSSVVTRQNGRKLRRYRSTGSTNSEPTATSGALTLKGNWNDWTYNVGIFLNEKLIGHLFHNEHIDYGFDVSEIRSAYLVYNDLITQEETAWLNEHITSIRVDALRLFDNVAYERGVRVLIQPDRVNYQVERLSY